MRPERPRQGSKGHVGSDSGLKGHVGNNRYSPLSEPGEFRGSRRPSRAQYPVGIRIQMLVIDGGIGVRIKDVAVKVKVNVIRIPI